MSLTEPDKNFFKAVSISAIVHFAAAALVLCSLAPIPAVLLPGNDQNIISVSLVGFSSEQKAKDLMTSRPTVLKVDNSGRISQPEKENITREEAKIDLSEKKTKLSNVALDVYTNEHFYPGKVRVSGEIITGQNSEGVNDSANVNGSTKWLKTPHLIPSYRRNNPPQYPMTARRKGHEGLVLVAAQVMADGTVGNVKVKKSSGYKDLDDSALEAVRKWLFQPGQRMGIAISMWVDVPIRFALKD